MKTSFFISKNRMEDAPMTYEFILSEDEETLEIRRFNGTTEITWPFFMDDSKEFVSMRTNYDIYFGRKVWKFLIGLGFQQVDGLTSENQLGMIRP